MHCIGASENENKSYIWKMFAGRKFKVNPGTGFLDPWHTGMRGVNNVVARNTKEKMFNQRG